jgi:thioesterase domain-containing protein
MARHYLDEIRVVQPKGPYAFAGACFGAAVAYEMARQVTERGEKVAYLALLEPTSRGADGIARRPSETRRSPGRVAAFVELCSQRLALYRDEMRTLPVSERLAYVAGKVGVVLGRLSRPLRPDVQREMSARTVYHCNVSALDAYRRRPLRGELGLIAIIETGRPRTGPARTARWEDGCDGVVVRDVVPARDSGDMVAGRNAQAVATLMGRHLRAAFGEGPLQLATSSQHDPFSVSATLPATIR